MRLTITVLPLLLAGCQPDVCIGTGRGPGMAVTIVDSVSASGAANGALLLTYVGKTTVDSVVGTRDDEVLYGADDQPGQYRVLVRRAGYTDWERTNVVISGSCSSLDRVTLVARLARP